MAVQFLYGGTIAAVLQRAGLRPDQLGNETAFASGAFARAHLGREWPLGFLERGRLNVNGDAIALGHPVGATGTRLVLTLLKELLRRGLATQCVGGGQGEAVCVETGE